jgi:hypothetical protein
MSGLPAIVLSVCEYVAYEKHLAVEMNGRDDAVLIAPDIEDVVIAHAIHGIEAGLQVRMIAETPALHSFAPCLQRRFRIPVVSGESQ